MKKRYSTLIIFLVLLLAIVICEYFIEDEETIEVLPVNVALNYEYSDEDTNISINVFEINSKKKFAKQINKEIRNIFINNANKVINDKANYKGTYKLLSSYNFKDNYLSIKIYEQDSNMENTSGNIYSVIYDYKNDMEIKLSGMCDKLKLDYDKVISNAKDYSYNKNKYVDINIPYVYYNENGNLEVITRSLIQTDKYKFWNNIEIYEVASELKDINVEE